jgi:hypothetical protein
MSILNAIEHFVIIFFSFISGTHAREANKKRMEVPTNEDNEKQLPLHFVSLQPKPNNLTRNKEKC